MPVLLPERHLVILTRRFQARMDVLQANTSRATGQAWAKLPAYERANVADFEELTAATIQGAKRAAVATANGYYSTLGSVRVPAVSHEAISVLFDREQPFLSYWHQLSEGVSWVDAVQAGRSTAEATGGNYVQSAARRTGDAVVEATGQDVIAWRRVLGAGSCDWCVTVSGQLYHSSESADFGHDRCNCVAVPVYGTRDPGAALNRGGAQEVDGD